MNREQRRAYERQIKKAPNAFICPKCNHKARFYTRSFKELDGKKHTILSCEYCNATLKEGETLEKLFPPGIYSPWDLKHLDIIIEEMEKKTDGQGKENSSFGNEEATSIDAGSSSEL